MEYSDILTDIRKIVRAINLESKRIEKEYGISIPQLLCLKFLYDHQDGRAAQKEIKAYLQLNASTVTGIITRLEKKALISKLPSSRDKRKTMIGITEKGAEIIRKAPAPLHDQITRSLDDSSEQQITALKSAFQLIIKFLGLENMDGFPIITADTNLTEELFES